MLRKSDIEILITQHQRRLLKLKEQQAKLGLNTPPDLLIEIEDIETEIQRCQTELETLENKKEEGEASDLGTPTCLMPSSGIVSQAQPQTVQKSGDVISVNITGNVSGKVAVGKKIVQD